MNIFDKGALKILSDEISRKNELLKLLNTSYTKALEYMDRQNDSALLEELDAQNELFGAINGSDKKETDSACDYDSAFKEAVAYLSRCGTDDELHHALKKVTDDIKAYRKLLKNCKTLNEKLVYRVNEAKTESELHIQALKNRRLIKSGYNTDYSSEKGLLINCISN
jgi:hypothetical protein